MARRKLPVNPLPPRQDGNTLPPWELINLNLLVLDSRLQPRTQLDHAMVEEYRQLFMRQAPDDYQCPAIIVYYINGTCLVADGHHRVTAAREAKRTQLHAHIIRDASKTLDDAWVHTMQVNITSGLSYNNKDKQKVVTWLLQHPTYGRWTPTELETLCKGKISDQTFTNHRNRLKIQDLEDDSKLEKGSRHRREAAERAALVAKASRDIHRQTGLLLGLAQDLQSAPAHLEGDIRAVREAVARLLTTLESLTTPAGMDDI